VNSTKPPDPIQTAGLQGTANTNAAISSAWLGNANQRSPVGTTKNTVARYVTVGGKKVPQFQQTFKYSPGQQKLYNQQLAMGQKMNTIGNAQLNRLNTSLSQPINFSGAPELAGYFSNYQNEVEAGMNERLAPQLQRDENATRQRLANMGLTQGSKAWTEEMDRLGRSANDARTQVLLASGGEARAAGAFQNQNRQQYINELMQQRNQPLNEISALMSGGQVAQPGSPNWSSYAVAAPDVAGNIYASNALQNQQSNAAMGGLFGLGATAAGGLFGF